MSSSLYYCKFRKDWLEKKAFRDWLKEIPKNPNQAFCHVCKKTIELSNMGQTALTSHMKGKKHMQAVLLLPGTTVQPTMKAFCCNTSQSQTAVDADGPSTSQRYSDAVQETDESSQKKSSIDTDIIEAKTVNPVGVSRYLVSKEVRKAEVIWAMKSVMGHFSFNSNADIGDVFRSMFPDSEIARNYKCGSTKLAYLICFGLAPYFKDKLIDKIRSAVGYVVSFDESLNKICQEGQMDIIVRCFSGDKVVSHYFNSEFLGHATAKDLLTAFKEGTSKLNPSHMLQVSMDGPNVNFKFLELLNEDRKKSDPDMPGLLQLGSCTLHVVHGALSSAMQKTGWSLEKLLRAIWYLFEDSPARRADFKEITKSDLFGLQFCSTRWVEDVIVAERATEIWDNLVKYVKETLKKPKKHIPTCASFITLQQFVNDPLVVAKLEVFISTAKIVKPFLKKYQTEKPMLPFITEDLRDILHNLMGRFIKPTVLEEANSAYKIATLSVVDESTWLPIEKVDPGFAAKRLLLDAQQSKTISPLMKKEFLAGCQKLYSMMTLKVLERCPLKFSLVRGLRALDSRFMVSHPRSAEDKMRIVLNKLVDMKWKQDRECDEIMRQFKELLEQLQRRYKTECECFSPDTEQLDTFFYSVIALPAKPGLKDLWELFQILLSLSHGQAAVERGFSINKDVLAPNLKTHSLVAQRLVYDSISHTGIPVASLEVTSGLLQSCLYAHGRYIAHLNAQKEEKEKQERARKRAADESELNVAKKKLKKLEDSVESLTKEADKRALQAENKSDFTLLAKSNALSQKAKELTNDIEKQKQLVNKLSAPML